jgi:arginine N-succinyltransferase
MGLLLRPVLRHDLGALRALASHLDTVNLPSDPVVLGAIIEAGHQSLAALGGAPGSVGSLTLMAESETGGLLGTASLFAQHGTPEDPHYYLRVVEQVVHSKQLNVDRARTLLCLEKDLEPWTELGGLVVSPQARGQGIGKLLVAARLLVVAMHRQHFCNRLLAELLPERRADGGNAFWDAVGKPLTGLDYYRADLLCRTDKEFIDAFFPDDHLVAELLPAEARAHIAHEGTSTTPVRALLHRAGFRWLGTIDPFDAGPHDGAAVTDLVPITASRARVLLDHPPAAPGVRRLCAHPRTLHMTVAEVEEPGDGLRLPADVAARLHLTPGDPVWTMPLDW